MFNTNDSITAIEIGTSTIKVVMAKPQPDGTIAAIGHDEIPSLNKVLKGDVANVPAIEELLSEVLNNLETLTGNRIGSVYLGVTGNHIHSTNVVGSVPITSTNRIITESDIIEATRNARSFNLPLEQKDIHTFQRTYIIDDNRRVSNPEGMVGNKLTADIHVIYGNYNKIQTICGLVNDVLGTPANDIAFSGIADYYGASMDGESTNGVLIIDIGAGVTEYSVFYHDGCLHSGQIAVGCEHIANDLSIGLNLPIIKCRQLLRKGCSVISKADRADKRIEVEMSLGQPPRIFKESVLQQIVEVRLKEILGIVRSELSHAFFGDTLNLKGLLENGVILCGGGALIPGIESIAGSTFNIPAKIGLPANISGIDTEINSPRYVTPIGLIHLGYRLSQLDSQGSQTLRQTAESEVGKLLNLCRKAFRF